MISKTERQIGYFIDAATELGEQGREWSYLPHISERAALFDEPYMKRRAAVNRLLKLVGVEREAYPNFYPSPVKMWHIADGLEGAGVIESHTTGPNGLKHPVQVYRLVPVENNGFPPESLDELAE